MIRGHRGRVGLAALGIYPRSYSVWTWGATGKVASVLACHSRSQSERVYARAVRQWAHGPGAVALYRGDGSRFLWIARTLEAPPRFRPAELVKLPELAAVVPEVVLDYIGSEVVA